jgi:hypothetical protein
MQGQERLRLRSKARTPHLLALTHERTAHARQKIELNVEILEGHLGCMKSTHSMNAATRGR